MTSRTVKSIALTSAILLTCAIMAADLSLRLGIAVVNAYLLVVMLTYASGSRRALWVAASTCSLLTLIGFVLSPSGGQVNQALANRALALLVIWVTALLCLRVLGLLDEQLERAEAAEQMAFEAARQRDEGRRKSKVMASIMEDWKSALAQLREHEQQTKVLLNSTAEGIYGLDLQGRCTFANDKCAALLGYDSIDDLMGKNMHELIHHSHRDGTPYDLQDCQIYKSFVQGSGAHVDDEVLWRRDGSSFPAEYWSFPMLLDGEMIGAVVTFFDVTERKAAEAEIQRINEELHGKNDEMQQFVYTVSHDLKSPLVTCKGFVGLMREDAEAQRWDDMMDSVGRIERATDRMGELIEDLLQLSRIGVIRNEPELVDVSELIDGLADELSTRLDENGAQLIIEDDLPPVIADRVRIKEVFENLLSNAIKYGCDTESPIIRVGGRQAEGVVRFHVADNGQGIAPEFQDRVFGLFQRLESDKEGTGVGLAAVARIMEVHGGRCGVESQVGSGAEFWVEFPASNELGDPHQAAIATEEQ